MESTSTLTIADEVVLVRWLSSLELGLAEALSEGTEEASGDDILKSSISSCLSMTVAAEDSKTGPQWGADGY